jgi:hypothetical protein
MIKNGPGGVRRAMGINRTVAVSLPDEQALRRNRYFDEYQHSYTFGIGLTDMFAQKPLYVCECHFGEGSLAQYPAAKVVFADPCSWTGGRHLRLYRDLSYRSVRAEL